MSEYTTRNILKVVLRMFLRVANELLSPYLVLVLFGFCYKVYPNREAISVDTYAIICTILVAIWAGVDGKYGTPDDITNF